MPCSMPGSGRGYVGLGNSRGLRLRAQEGLKPKPPKPYTLNLRGLDWALSIQGSKWAAVDLFRGHL